MNVRVSLGAAAHLPDLRAFARLVRLRTTLGSPYVTCCGWNSIGAFSTDHATLIVCTSVSSFAVIAFAQTYNDIRDRFVDALDKQHRPLPSGAVGLTAARTTAGALAVLALAAAAPAGWSAAALTAAALAVAVLYSAKLKSTVLWGNASVAVTCAAMHLYGPVVAGSASTRTAAGFALVLLLIFGSEVLKTAEDLDADRRAGLSTLATERGRTACAAVAFGTALALLACCAFALLVAPRPVPGFALFGAAPLVVLVTATCVALRRSRPVSARTISAANDRWRRGWRLSILGLAFT